MFCCWAWEVMLGVLSLFYKKTIPHFSAVIEESAKKGQDQPHVSQEGKTVFSLESVMRAFLTENWDSLTPMSTNSTARRWQAVQFSNVRGTAIYGREEEETPPHLHSQCTFFLHSSGGERTDRLHGHLATDHSLAWFWSEHLRSSVYSKAYGPWHHVFHHPMSSFTDVLLECMLHERTDIDYFLTCLILSLTSYPRCEPISSGGPTSGTWQLPKLRLA